MLLCQTHCQRLRPQLPCPLHHLLIGSGDEDVRQYLSLLYCTLLSSAHSITPSVHCLITAFCSSLAHALTLSVFIALLYFPHSQLYWPIGATVMMVWCWPVGDGNHLLDQWLFRMHPLAKAQLLLPAWHLIKVGDRMWTEVRYNILYLMLWIIMNRLTCVYSPSRHILIVMAVAYASTLIAYLDANYEIPYSLPGLQYWPSDNCVLGLPYIVLKGTIKTQKRC